MDTADNSFAGDRNPPVARTESQRSRDWLWIALLACATFTAYLPAIRGGFIWDDDAHVTKPALQSWAGLGRIWSDVTATQQYYPILHTAFWIEHRLWGETPLGYHLLNVGLHCIAACLFALVLLRLRVRGAWLAGAIFALHPVHVESVAWITEQKNTWSLVFYLLAALMYLRFDRERGWRSYGLALVFFIFALGCKTVTATLPAALLVLLWWQCGRLSFRRDVIPLLSWFGVGVCAGLFTAMVERKLIGAEGADFELSFVERALLAGRVVWFYAGKLLWPSELTFVYPRWSVSAAAVGQYIFPLALLISLAGLAVWSRRTRAPLTVALLFIGSLFPVLGFFNVYPFIFSFVADHFVYLASLAIIGGAAALLAQRFADVAQPWSWAASLVLLFTLGALTWRQSRMYTNAETLYRATIDRNPASWLAYNNLGVELHATSRDAEAVACYERALALRSDRDDIRNNLGLAFASLGRFSEAVAVYEDVLRRRPYSSETHHNLALALAKSGRAEQALPHFQLATLSAEKHPEIWCDWGFIFDEAGRFSDAIQCCERAVASGARVDEAQGHWAVALANQGNYAEAIDHLRAAVNGPRADPMQWNNLGKCLQLSGRSEEAIAAYEAALRIRPDQPEVLNNLGIALRSAGRTDDAIKRFEAVLKSAPEATGTLYNLALCLRDAGRIEEAKQRLARAQQLDPNAPPVEWSR